MYILLFIIQFHSHIYNIRFDSCLRFITSDASKVGGCLYVSRTAEQIDFISKSHAIRRTM